MKRPSGIVALLRPEIREKLYAVIRRNEIADTQEAIEFCIETIWFYQIGQFEKE